MRPASASFGPVTADLFAAEAFCLRQGLTLPTRNSTIHWLSSAFAVTLVSFFFYLEALVGFRAAHAQHIHKKQGLSFASSDAQPGGTTGMNGGPTSYYKVVPPSEMVGPFPPFLELPPSMPSAFFPYPGEFFDKYKGQPAKDLFERLERKLRKRGYLQLSYYTCEKGLAFATRFEKIDDRGKPIQNGRWDLASTGMTDPSEWATRMINPIVGRYRAFLWVLSPNEAVSSMPPESFLRQSAAFEKGFSYLSEELKTKTRIVTEDHLSLYVYEYYVIKGQPPKFVSRSGLDGFEHLRAAGLLPKELLK